MKTNSNSASLKQAQASSPPILQTASLFQKAELQKTIRLELKGVTVQYQRDGKPRILKGVPSFKTGKTAFAWRDKATGKIMARPLTLPEHKKWMEQAIHLLESQLRSALQITDAKIQTVASPRSWIASMVPLDDSWAWCPDISVKSELCAPGEEGAVIEITRIS